MAGPKAKLFPTWVFLRWEGDPPYLIGSPSISEATNSEAKTLGLFRLHSNVETRIVTQHRVKGTKDWIND